ncbi:uncharacterized protein Z520_11448 [Fonsecaea multimorphosa CBS 102226]|uniref:Uncharacterized protein n=1 Tax=Fonsecaea multimorphosa CBS 102226 TaxID=1442371 RepID=A0A0D2GTJ7_9EURO|nr:uncharacterized protein Z520_11448 [Fonsecaea multimorphosa CBS 102226]KIX92785.1 hypothetical protein Z520_11448 [Fonsecaea multimorphosa CBS 102226]OAL18033.1 hypothetical protein AYO22_11049 [Fonsecaea multimorphosa]
MAPTNALVLPSLGKLHLEQVARSPGRSSALRPQSYLILVTHRRKNAWKLPQKLGRLRYCNILISGTPLGPPGATQAFQNHWPSSGKQSRRQLGVPNHSEQISRGGNKGYGPCPRGGTLAVEANHDGYHVLA